MRKTKWIYREGIAEENNDLEVDRDILKVLSNRGIVGKENVEKFILCDLDFIKDPFGIADVEKAVDRLILAKEKGESVWVYGDYDVDGITSVSLIYLVLKELGYDIKYYIPLRDEGYGLNKEALTGIASEGGNLVITVDCGISSHQEIEHANSLGMDTIITDHHEINNGLPEAYAVINPKREENAYSFKSLAGVGTAFMLMLALYRRLGKEADVYKYLDIVAIGTVADIVPLMEENRIFVKHGLELLKRSSWLGLRVLLREVFGDAFFEKNYSTYDIGYVIGPIFNAAGRLEDAKMAVEVLIGQDKFQLEQLVRVLVGKNNERKEIQGEILQKCQEMVEAEKLDEKNTIVVAGKDFHHGVIGIVASKLMDQYYRPIVVMEIKEDEGIAVASCRSIENFNIVEALNTMSELFVKYGGHAAAAGFSIPIENIDIFKERLENLASQQMDEDDFYKNIKIDKDLPLYKLTYELLDKLSLLEPYGFGNPSPLFVLKNCNYKNLRLIGKEKNHIMMDLVKDGIEVKGAVWFGALDMFEHIVENPKIDAVCKLKLESYKDRYQIKAYLEDVKPSSSDNVESSIEDYFNLYDMRFPMEAVVYTRKEVLGEKLSVSFGENEVTIVENRGVIGYLDSQMSYMLRQMKELFRYDFKVELKEIVRKEENYNIHIIISRNYNFTSYSLKAGELFKEIKNHLIGDFQYNSFQRKVLGTFFKEKKNVQGIAERGRGLETIIQNVALYCENTGKKALLITAEKVKEKTEAYIDTAASFKEGYDYYIYLNSYSEYKASQGQALILSEEDKQEIEGFQLIKDCYKFPDNVIIVDSEKELTGKSNIYSRKLPYDMRYKIYENIDKYKEIYSTDDIKILL